MRRMRVVLMGKDISRGVKLPCGLGVRVVDTRCLGVFILDNASGHVTGSSTYDISLSRLNRCCLQTLPQPCHHSAVAVCAYTLSHSAL